MKLFVHDCNKKINLQGKARALTTQLNFPAFDICKIGTAVFILL